MLNINRTLQKKTDVPCSKNYRLPAPHGLECTQNRAQARVLQAQQAVTKAPKMLPILFLGGPLDFVAIDTLGPLAKTKRGNLFIIVITDRYSMLERATTVPKTTAPNVALEVLENFVMPYGIPNTIMTDNGPLFVPTSFAALYPFMGTKMATTAEFHHQANGQVERFKKALVAYLRHQNGEYQTNWDQYVQSLTYENNTPVQRTTKTSPFSLVLSRQPPGPIMKEKLKH